MSKKFFTILIAFILIILLIVLIGYYFVIKNSSSTGGTNASGSGTSAFSTFRNFFPFGGNGNSGSNSNSTTTGTLNGVNTGDGSLGSGIKNISIENTQMALPVVVNGNQVGTGGTGTSSTVGTSQYGTSGSGSSGRGLPGDYGDKLREIGTEPVAGAGIFDTKEGDVIMYIAKATGHVYETELFSSRQGRISNTTIPSVYNAGWGSGGSSFFAQTLSDDNQSTIAYLLSIKQSGATPDQGYNVAGMPLTAHVSAISTNGGNIFYLQSDPTDLQSVSTGYISSINGKNIHQVWQSPLRDILSQFVNASTIALTTKPYPNVGGYLYFINTTTGNTKRILGNIAGLSTLVSPDASTVIVLSEADDAELAIYSVTHKTSQGITPTTFPEKCVWSKKDLDIIYCAVPEESLTGLSLTHWYMGIDQYTDDIWKYNLKTGASSIVEGLTSASYSGPIDATHLILSTNEQYLVFINKRDGRLWSLDLNK